jgi:hypothetical protein
MTQRPIIAYLSLKWMSAREIHDDIVVTFGPNAVSYSLVTHYLRKARFPPSKPKSHPTDVQRDLDDSDQVILAALENGPFALVRQPESGECLGVEGVPPGHEHLNIGRIKFHSSMTFI